MRPLMAPASAYATSTDADLNMRKGAQAYKAVPVTLPAEGKSVENLPPLKRVVGEGQHGYPWQRKALEYDFTPFKQCPGVFAHARSLSLQGELDVVPTTIPKTVIPSPFAKDLGAQAVFNLKNWLTGPAENKPVHDNVGGNGPEIWKSWSRAWCMWNGYYIEGRVNEVWVGGALEQYEAGVEHSNDGIETSIEKVGLLEDLAIGDWYVPGEKHDGPAPGQDPMITLWQSYESYIENSGGDKPFHSASGGFYALKHLNDFREPFEMESDKAKEAWFDNIENTVWRPRRRGEMEGQPRIDFDAKSEGSRMGNGLVVDGAVDCGAEPYPALRPIDRYIEAKAGALKRQTVWDGVTGTLFNMPVEDLPGQGNIPFPLDIRRVNRQTLQRVVAPVADGSAFKVIETSKSYPSVKYRDMEPADPYWVTESQREARDRAPLDNHIKNASLPVDDAPWQEEVRRDMNYEAMYFVTNLDGRLLVINGMEIHLGEVAGPLPAFAVIETPGGQISFWWGVGGRHWKAGSRVPHFEERWQGLRSLEGWENVGLRAGDVWGTKIKEMKEQGIHGGVNWTRCRASHRRAQKESYRNHCGTKEETSTGSADVPTVSSAKFTRGAITMDSLAQTAALLEPSLKESWPSLASNCTLSRDDSCEDRRKMEQLWKDQETALLAEKNEKENECMHNDRKRKAVSALPITIVADEHPGKRLKPPHNIEPSGLRLPKASAESISCRPDVQRRPFQAPYQTFLENLGPDILDFLGGDLSNFHEPGSNTALPRGIAQRQAELDAAARRAKQVALTKVTSASSYSSSHAVKYDEDIDEALQLSLKSHDVEQHSANGELDWTISASQASVRLAARTEGLTLSDYVRREIAVNISSENEFNAELALALARSTTYNFNPTERQSKMLCLSLKLGHCGGNWEEVAENLPAAGKARKRDGRGGYVYTVI